MPPLFPHQRRFRGFAAAGIILLLATFAFAPLSLKPGSPGLLPCPFLNLTGLPCALCGGTRSAQAILHGDISKALYLNPAGVPAVAALIFLAVIFAAEALRGRPLANWDRWLHVSSRMVPLAIALLFLWWIPHLVGALRVPKPELLDLRNPIAKAAYERVHRTNVPANP